MGTYIRVALGVATLFMEKYLVPIYFRPILMWLVVNAIFEITFVPLFEETIYRGTYLNLFERLYGDSTFSRICGIVASSLIFGWIHPVLPVIKGLGGIALGTIYLWRKNLLMNTLIHACVNSVLIFFEVA